MREVNKVIETSESVPVKRIVSGERISYYSVDANNKSINIVTEMTDDSGTVLSTGNYHAEGDEYVELPTEDDLWEIIDK